MFSVMLRPCTCSVLSQILDPAVPVVWIRRHMPRQRIDWWRTPVPLSGSAQAHEVEVRLLQFDIQLATSRFLELLPEFEEHGMELLQMARRVPDTLTLEGLSDAAADRVLLQNGLHVRFFLPHAVEYAQLSSPDRSVLERILKRPEMSALAYEEA